MLLEREIEKRINQLSNKFPVVGILYYSGLASVTSASILALMTLGFLYFAIRF